MPAITSHRAAHLATIVAALLIGGCASQTGQPAAPTTLATTTVAPTTVPGPGPLTTQEQAWLDAVENLFTKMNKVFPGPTHLTRSALRSMAGKLRGCSRELARIGSPSQRLQPVAALVKRACDEYNKGAQCFDTAARIGTPVAGSANDRKFTKAIECGFASSGKGGEPLADALNKAAEIRAESG